MVNRINAAEASARATAIKAEAIAERRAHSAAKRKYGQAWVTQRAQILKAAVDGKEFYETAEPIIFCRDLLTLGFAVYEVPIPSYNIFEKLAIDYSPRLNKARILATKSLDKFIDKIVTEYACLHGVKRQFHNVMHSRFNEYINDIVDADDLLTPNFFWGFFAEGFYKDDFIYADGLTSTKYRSQFDAIAKSAFKLKTIEISLKNEKSEVEDGLQEIEYNEDDILDPFMELSSIYKLFEVRWADDVCDFEAKGEFNAEGLNWICSQVGIAYLNAVFDVIEDAVNKGKKSIDFIFLDKNDEWEISSKSMPPTYSISPALLGEILTLDDYSVEIKDVSEKSKKLIIAW